MQARAPSEHCVPLAPKSVLPWLPPVVGVLASESKQHIVQVDTPIPEESPAAVRTRLSNALSRVCGDSRVPQQSSPRSLPPNGIQVECCALKPFHPPRCRVRLPTFRFSPDLQQKLRRHTQGHRGKGTHTGGSYAGQCHLFDDCSLVVCYERASVKGDLRVAEALCADPVGSNQRDLPDSGTSKMKTTLQAMQV